MPHAARAWPETDIHLITAAGNAHCRLFLDAADRDLFLDLLDDVVARHEWGLYAWCLLGNHVHLVVRSNRAGLHLGMQRLKGVYAMRFHRRHHTCGHLFKRPYHSRPILTLDHLHRACGYTLRNPVRHGFVERAEDWEWSSFRTTARIAPAPRRRLTCEPFDRLLQLDGTPRRVDVMRAYVQDTDIYAQ